MTQRATQFLEVARAGPYDELVALPGERAPGLEQRPQGRQDLLGGGVAKLDHLDAGLRKGGPGAQHQEYVSGCFHAGISLNYLRYVS